MKFWQTSAPFVGDMTIILKLSLSLSFSSLEQGLIVYTSVLFFFLGTIRIQSLLMAPTRGGCRYIHYTCQENINQGFLYKVQRKVEINDVRRHLALSN